MLLGPGQEPSASAKHPIPHRCIAGRAAVASILCANSLLQMSNLSIDHLGDDSAATDSQVDRQDDRQDRRKNHTNAATGASAAGVRALSAQALAFWFRAPAKAFIPTRIE